MNGTRRTGAAMTGSIDGGETAGAPPPDSRASPDSHPVEVLRTPTPDSRWSKLLFFILVGQQVLPLALDPTQVGRWILLAVVLAGYAAFWWVGRRRTRGPVVVELHDDRLVVSGYRRQQYPWQEIGSLQVDPTGGPRFIRLQMRDGRYLSPASLVEDDVPRLIARWEAERRRRSP